jgi:hypothetical protein
MSRTHLFRVYVLDWNVPLSMIVAAAGVLDHD